MQKNIVLLLIVLLSVACGSTEEVEVTREVEVITEVTRIVEKIEEIEVTRVVEVVEEVTREIEVYIEITATPKPAPTATATPESPIEGSYENPYPFGVASPLNVNDGEKNFLLTVKETIRGDEAMQRILAANQFNETPPDNSEFVLILIHIEYTDGTDALEIDKYNLSIVTNGQIINYLDTSGYSPCCIDPDFDLAFFPGGEGEGWVALPVAVDDPSPLLNLTGSDLYFSLTP